MDEKSLLLLLGLAILLFLLWQLVRAKFPFKKISSEKPEIYKEWDAFISPLPEANKRPFYSERNEVHNVARWILNSGGGSLLVSGVRGVGKTAFVYYAIYIARRSDIWSKLRVFTISNLEKTGINGYAPKLLKAIGGLVGKLIISIFTLRKDIAFIPVNMAVLDQKLEGESSQDGKKEAYTEILILKHLIQSYFYSSDEAGKNGRDLYLYSISRSDTTILDRIGFNLSYYGTLPLISFFALTFALLLLFYSVIQPTFFNDEVKFYLKIFTALLSALEIVFFISVTVIGIREQKINYDSENLNYLQMRFQQLLAKSNKIPVFVIDEIDKLYDESEEKLNNLVKNLKNLLTISSGRFIFITSNKYFEALIEKKTDEDQYPITSTYFNWKIFLPQAGVREIRAFVFNIVKGKLDDQGKKQLEPLIYYVYTMSGGVFSRVKEVIREFTSYEDGKLYLDISLKRLDNEKRSKARLGKIFELLYDKGHGNLLSMQRFNYLRHESLFAILEELLKQNTRELSIRGLCELHQGRGYSLLNEEEKAIIRNDTRDLLNDIKKYSGDAELTYNIPDSHDDSFSLPFSLTQVRADLSGLPDDRDEITTTEKELQQEIENINESLSRYKNLTLEKPYELLEFIKPGLSAIYETLISFTSSISPGKYTPQEEVQKRIEEATEIKNLLDSNDRLIFDGYLSKKIPDLLEASQDEVLVALNGIEQFRKNKILENASLFKYKNKYLVVIRNKTIRANFERIQEKQKKLSANIFAITINKNITLDLIKIGFHKNNVTYIKIDKNLKNINKFLETAKLFIDWQEPQAEPAPSPSLEA